MTATKPEEEPLNPPVMEIPARYRAPSLLAFGGLCAVLGFVLITVIGVIEFMIRTDNKVLKEPFKSGHGYWPSTVSEMVYNQDSPGGKLFYTFGMIAGVCIFMSHYPFHLRNVYTGTAMVPGTNIYWTTFRQICPSMGLWLLIGVNTYPTTIALHSKGHLKLFCVLLHLLGAGMMFVGYMVAELQCLGMVRFDKSIAEDAFEKRERPLRRGLAWTILGGFVLFCVMQVMLNIAKKQHWCCGDVWKLKGEEVEFNKSGILTNVTLDRPMLMDTASGSFLLLKVLSFVFEDIAGLSLVFSHIAIWYYAEESEQPHGEHVLVNLEESKPESK